MATEKEGSKNDTKKEIQLMFSCMKRTNDDLSVGSFIYYWWSVWKYLKLNKE